MTERVTGSPRFSAVRGVVRIDLPPVDGPMEFFELTPEVAIRVATKLIQLAKTASGQEQS